MTNFKPAINNDLLVALTKLAFPLKLHQQRLRISVTPNLRGVFARLKGKRTILLANHPDADDPYVIFQLSKMVDENFYYMAARDVFGVESPLYSWYGQNIGCYSIDRSEVDIEAIKMTMTLVKRNTRKIVIFPEGDLTGLDFQIASFKAGTVHLLLEAQEKVAPDPLVILPIGIHYQLRDPHIVEAALNQMDKVSAPGATIKERLDSCIEQGLANAERELQINRKSGASFSERAQIAGAATVHRVADRSGLTNTRLNALRLLYKLRSSHVYDATAGRLDVIKMADLGRAEKLLFLSRLLTIPSSNETMYRILQSLAPFITGGEIPKADRLAMVHLGEPVEMLDFHSEYVANKEACIRKATRVIKDELSCCVSQKEAYSA